MRGVGDREVVRVRPFVRVAANLSLSAVGTLRQHPAVQSAEDARAVRRSRQSPREDAAGAEPDAEVSFVTRDLAAVLPRAKIAAVVPIDEVLARVREAANWTGGNAAPAQPAADAAGSIRSPTPPNGTSPIPTPASRRASCRRTSRCCRRPPPGHRRQRLERAHRHASRRATRRVDPARARRHRPRRSRRSRPRSAARPRRRPQGRPEAARPARAATGGKRLQPVRVIIASDTSIEAVVALSDLGKYVAVDVRSVNTGRRRQRRRRGRRQGRAALPEHLRDRAAQPDSAPGDRRPDPDLLLRRRFPAQGAARRFVRVLYAGEDENSSDGKSDVLFASLTVGGETKKFYRFQTTDDSIVDYYDETGKSAKKFLVRKPVADGIMRSGFGSRNHPILGYMKMHTGVDWAAPDGHADLRLRQRHHREGRLGRRLRQIHPHPPRQRLRDRLRPHDRVRARHGAGQARAPGPGDRLSSARPACRPAPTCTTKSWSTAASSIRCGSSCRAAACSTGRCSPASSRSASGSTA